MRQLSLALDWTPNTNHTGFYIANHFGFYRDKEIELTFISPDIDHYETSSVDRVLLGMADIGLGPSEYVIHSHENPETPSLIAIGTTLGKDASAFVSPKTSQITRPLELEGKTYLAYDNCFEKEIVSELIKNDGGKGEFIYHPLNRLEVWPLFMDGTGQATWIFLPWEKLEADQKGIELNIFKPEDFGIPYGYSPVIFVNEKTLAEKSDLLRDFMIASRKGFDFAINNPREAARILIQEANHSALSDEEMVYQSQEMITDYYVKGDETWGWMNPQKWEDFHVWLSEKGLLSLDNQKLPSAAYFRNLIDQYDLHLPSYLNT